MYGDNSPLSMGKSKKAPVKAKKAKSFNPNPMKLAPKAPSKKKK